VSGIKYPFGDDSVYHVHEYNIDHKANEIYLVGEESYVGQDMDGGNEPGVEYTMANRFIKNLNLLTRQSQEPILVHMKTCGGLWEEGIAIYDAIKLCPNYITILNYTHARSMSSLIFLAADYRVMMPHSTFMFHEGTFATHGTVKQTRTGFEQLQKSNEQMIEIYVEHLKDGTTHGKMKNWSRKRIREWIITEINKKEDVFFDAEESVKLGFADEIFDGNLDKITSIKK